MRRRTSAILAVFLVAAFVMCAHAQSGGNGLFTPRESAGEEVPFTAEIKESECSPPVVWIPDTCGFKRGTVEFSIYAENDIPLSAMQCDLLFHPGVGSFLHISLDERAHECRVDYSSIEGGVRSAVECTEIDTGCGPLVTFFFEEPEEVVCRGSIELSVRGVSLADAEGNSYQFDHISGFLPIRYLGDVNWDCELNVLDAVLGVARIIGLPPPVSSCDMWALDVTSDGIYTILDILSIIDIILGYGYPEKGVEPVSGVTRPYRNFPFE